MDRFKSFIYNAIYRLRCFTPWKTATWGGFDTTSSVWPFGYVCSNCNFVSGDKPKRCPCCKSKMKNAEF